MSLDSISVIFDRYTESFGSIFRHFVTANTTYLLGQHAVNEVSPLATVTLQVEADAVLEPIQFMEIQARASDFQAFILNTFQERYVRNWQDFLDELFAVFLERHFAGDRTFVELKKRPVRVNFAAQEKIEDQIRTNLVEDFSFIPYKERIKIISEAVNSDAQALAELALIYKHVLIRNANQHGRQILDDYITRSLGCAQIMLLDDNGKPQQYQVGAELHLSIPELHLLHRSFLYVIGTWRTNYA